ncbi:MAG: LamG domain-containing protein [Gemmatimonadetes bacterium]|nr:LamG domain-containing protein [Gemmatimonadota bacterium]
MRPMRARADATGATLGRAKVKKARRTRGWAIVLMWGAVGACGGQGATDPALDDELASSFDPGDPPPESGEDFHLMFDGVDDRVLIPWDASFPTDVFTIAAWLRLTAPGRRAAVIARGEDDNSFNLSWQMYVGSAGSLEIMLEASNEDNYCYPNNDCVPLGVCESGDLFVADGAWHHVAATRDVGGTLVIYVDAVEQARCEGTGIPSSNNQQFLSVGATHGQIGPLPPGGKEPPIWFFPGEIDNPAMWSRSLSPSEIQAVHETGVDVISLGLQGYWSLNEGQGQTVFDRSPAANHGYRGAEPDVDSADPAWVQ